MFTIYVFWATTKCKISLNKQRAKCVSTYLFIYNFLSFGLKVAFSVKLANIVNKQQTKQKQLFTIKKNLFNFSNVWTNSKSCPIPKFHQIQSINDKVRKVNKQQHACKPVCLHYISFKFYWIFPSFWLKATYSLNFIEITLQMNKLEK